MTVLINKEEIFKENGKTRKTLVHLKAKLHFYKRIDSLSNHLKSNKKDFNTERSLLKMVGKRRNYLKNKP